MKSINRTCLLGNVGKDPEVRSTAGGTVVSTFSIATTHRFKQNDEWKDATEWHNVVAYGRTAEIVRDYVKKGGKVYVEGRLTTRSWDDKESGRKAYRTEVVVEDLILLSGKDQVERQGYRAPEQTSTEDEDDSIPF